ncbi:MAG: rod-binding protein [Rhizobiaceae bacterium]|jgi:Rod binding domain-containing protein|nr:rod-binding protein [Rhizobiaceae bacterium]
MMIAPVPGAPQLPALVERSGSDFAMADPKLGRAFEAMILRPMIDAMLPESEAVFGSGPGADVWKSFYADAMANEIAAHGGLGLARLLPENPKGAS